MSGYTVNTVVQRIPEKSVHFIEKPLRLDSLARKFSLQTSARLEAVHPRHEQGKDKQARLKPHRFHPGLEAVRRGLCFKPLLGKYNGQHLADLEVVVHNQDLPVIGPIE